MKAPNTCTEPDCGTPWRTKGLCGKHYQWRRYHGTLPEKPPAATCEDCGKNYQPTKWGTSYCSRICNDRAYYTRHAGERRAETCEQCGDTLSHMTRKARFCSEKCGNDFRNAERAAAARTTMLATRRPCRGCEGPIPAARRGNAVYCSEECKSRARRHESYGLTKAELDQLLAQGEQCAICGTSDWGPKGPQVDHDHVTGAVRGVLDVNCNNGLGRFGDDPARLRAAADYLEAAVA